MVPPAILSACYSRIYKYDESLTYALKCLNLEPDNLLTYVVLCNAYYRVNDIPHTLEYCNKLIESDNAIAVSLGWGVKGRYYFDHSNITEAIKCFNNALANNPDNVLALVGLGFINVGYFKNSDKALEYFTKTLKIEPHNAEALMGLGTVYFVKKDYNNAIKKCQEACEKDPNNFMMWFVLGGVFYEKNDYINTISCMEKAVALEPKWGKGWYILGCAYLYSADYDNASKCLSRAVELEPNNVTYKQHYQEAVQRGNK